MEREPWTANPRPDLAEDAIRWQHLLTLALDHDGSDPDGVFGSLHGLRCLGARLVAEGEKVRLTAGEMEAGEYDRLRAKWLLPRKATLTMLLQRVATMEETK